MDPLFASIFRGRVAGGYLTEWRAMNGTLLLALDGLPYFSSAAIHCATCSTAQHAHGTVSYRHQALTPVLVAPGYDKVIPLMPEFSIPFDDIRALTRYLCFASWDDLLTCMRRGLEREIPNTS